MPLPEVEPAAGAHPEVADLWVVCLCAAWCGVCRDYRALFDDVAAIHPRARFVWVDVEDESDLAGDIDVDTFPTVLLAAGGQARFLGPLLPQAGVLRRLVENLEDQSALPAAHEAQALLARVAGRHG